MDQSKELKQKSPLSINGLTRVFEVPGHDRVGIMRFLFLRILVAESLTKVRFRASETVLSSSPSLQKFQVPLLQFYFVCTLWFHMWSLFCHYLFLIFPSFGAPGGLCVMLVAFPEYFYLNFRIKLIGFVSANPLK